MSIMLHLIVKLQLSLLFYLEWLPRSGVVHTLVDGHGVWLSVAEVKGDVGQLVLLL